MVSFQSQWRGALGCSLPLLLIQLLSRLSTTSAANVAMYKNIKYIETTNDAGQSLWLRDARKPALYTQNFGDCLGSSLINVTRFDAAYYKDNMTVLFHLEGNTNVANESLICMENSRGLSVPAADPSVVYIGVFAYGQARFDLTFNPCNAQIYRCVHSSPRPALSEREQSMPHEPQRSDRGQRHHPCLPV